MRDLEKAAGLPPAEREKALAKGRETVDTIKAARAEIKRRSKQKHRAELEREMAKLQGMGTIHERIAKAAETEERRKAERAARRHELAEKTSAERADRRKKAIAAGQIFQPTGGWDSETADALGSVFSRNFLWELATKPSNVRLGPEHILRLWWAGVTLNGETAREYVRAHGLPPSLDEIAVGLFGPQKA